MSIPSAGDRSHTFKVIPTWKFEISGFKVYEHVYFVNPVKPEG